MSILKAILPELAGSQPFKPVAHLNGPGQRRAFPMPLGGALVSAALLDLGSSQLSLAGLVALAVVLVLSGLLVPRRTVKDLIQERDDWKTAFQTSEEARAEQGEQIRELTELAKTTYAAIAALPKRRSDDEVA